MLSRGQNHSNNTDIQPNIFQNPVLIFLNEQVKAHENIFFNVTKKLSTGLFSGFLKGFEMFNSTTMPFLCKLETTNTVKTWLISQDPVTLEYTLEVHIWRKTEVLHLPEGISPLEYLYNYLLLLWLHFLLITPNGLSWRKYQIGVRCIPVIVS